MQPDVEIKRIRLLFRKGDRVGLAHLKKKKFNGLKCTVLSFDPIKARYQIKLDSGKAVSIKVENVAHPDLADASLDPDPIGQVSETTLWLVNRHPEKEDMREQLDIQYNYFIDNPETSIPNMWSTMMIAYQEAGMKLRMLRKYEQSINLYQWIYDRMFNREQDLETMIAKVGLLQKMNVVYGLASEWDDVVSVCREGLELMNFPIFEGQQWSAGDSPPALPHLRMASSFQGLKARFLAGEARGVVNQYSFGRMHRDPAIVRKNLIQAHGLFQKAISALDSVPFEDSTESVYGDYSNHLKDIGHVNEAIKICKLQIEKKPFESKMSPTLINQRYGGPERIKETATYVKRLGDLYLNAQKVKNATERYEDALEILYGYEKASKTIVPSELTEIYMHLSLCYLRLKKWNKAIEAVKKGEAMAKLVTSRFDDIISRQMTPEFVGLIVNSAKRRDRSITRAWLDRFKVERIDLDVTKCVRKAFKAEKECARCHAKSKKLFDCARCGKVSYCGRECQKKDWKKHKPVCGTAV